MKLERNTARPSNQDAPEPARGRIVGTEYRLPMRVYYEDTDAAGIVYYANYLKFAERARTEMLRIADVNQSDIRKHYDLVFAVRSCTVEYLRPAMLDDSIEVRCRVERVGGATVEILQDVWRDDSCLAQLKVRIACLRSDGQRPARMPAAVQVALRRFVSGSMTTSVGES